MVRRFQEHVRRFGGRRGPKRMAFGMPGEVDDATKLQNCIEMLADYGIGLPGDTNLDNWIERLAAALAGAKAAKEKIESDAQDQRDFEDAENERFQNNLGGGPGFAAMSLGRRGAVEEAESDAIVGSMFTPRDKRKSAIGLTRQEADDHVANTDVDAFFGKKPHK